MDQELVQYLDERFDGLASGLDRRFEQIDQRFVQIDRRFEAVDQRFDEVKRHTGMLVEDLRHELHLVADGLLMHIEVRHREDQEYFDGKFEGIAALFRSSYDHLQQQQTQLRESQDQLRQRLENLERNRPN